MKFKVSHFTQYIYNDQVFLEPHSLRFKPKNNPNLALKKFKINLVAEPSGMSDQIDIENNHVLLCWFDNLHAQLKIHVYFTVEVKDFNPFNFLVHPPIYLHLPFKYEPRTEQLLKPALVNEEINEDMVGFYQYLLESTKYSTVDFLVQLTREIHSNFNLQSREIGKPYSPSFTFSAKVGSCRDLAWMQIHMLRHMGIASRFVSGYFYIDSDMPQFELHAWVEAYLPGAGWIGLDPSHGILTGVYHIPVSSSAFFEETMPVSGTIRGKANSVLKNKIEISLTA